MSRQTSTSTAAALSSRDAAHQGWHRDAGDPRASHHYHERRFDVTAVKLLPGEYYVSGDDIVLTTVLGSCVSACLYDSGVGVGGMNHFMLPDAGEGVASSSARYGSYAMELLINELLKRGARRKSLEAKVFGGANVLRGFTENHVGMRNSKFVREYLAAERIRIVAEDLLDTHPRKIFFFPKTARVLVNSMPLAGATAALATESAYGKRLQSAPVQGDVELF